MAFRSQSKAWYDEKIESIPNETRELLEKYSGVASKNVFEHVERIRSEAFAIMPYPCIGQGKFLNVNLSKHPLYDEVLSRVKSGQKIVDVGCCFGTDLRKLIVDGASPHDVFGVDVEQSFLDKGFELYQDADKFPKSSCIAENMLEPRPSKNLEPLVGKIDIAYLASFLHLFDVHDQLKAMRKIVLLLNRKPGSLLIGRQMGNSKPGSYKKRLASIDSASYYHNPASFTAFISLLAAETDTNWEVSAALDDKGYMPENMEPEEVEKAYPWLYPGTKGLRFTARLL